MSEHVVLCYHNRLCHLYLSEGNPTSALMSTSFSTRQQHTGFSGLHFLFSRVAKDIREIFFGLLFEKLFVNHHSIFHILIFYAQQLMLCIVLLTWTIGGHSGWFPSQYVWMHWRSSSISPVRLFALTSETLSFPRHSYVCMYVYIFFKKKKLIDMQLKKTTVSVW